MIRACAVGCLLTLGVDTSPALAQDPAPARVGDAVRVIADEALLYARCDPGAPTRAILKQGDLVVVEAVATGWVRVRVSGSQEQGCMRRSVLAPVVPEAPAAAQRSQARAGARRTSPGATWADRAFISANGSWQAVSDTFSDSRSFSVDAETARFTSSYDVKSNAAFDIGGVARVWRMFGVGVAVTRYRDERDVAIAGTIPHPFYFSRDRAISGVAAGERQELATHLQAAIVAPVGGRILVAFLAGPSFFKVKQSVVTAVDYSHQYPFDEATFSSATVAVEEESKTGFGVGADVMYSLTDVIGIGGIMRFSRASVDFSLGKVDVGGFSGGAGVRVRIPGGRRRATPPRPPQPPPSRPPPRRPSS